MVVLILNPLLYRAKVLSPEVMQLLNQASWLVRLTNAPKAAAISVSAYCSGSSVFSLFSPPRDLLLSNKVRNTFKRKFITLYPAFLTALYWQIFQSF